MTYEKITEPILEQLHRLIKNYRLITLLFVGALLLETFLLILFFSFLVKSALFSLTLAALLITFFSFYTLRNTQAIEKESAMRELIQKYLKGTQTLSQGIKTPSDLKQWLGEACLYLASQTQAEKAKRNAPPHWLAKPFTLLWEASQRALIDENLQLFQELALQKAIECFSEQIRLAPCLPAAHFNLALAWIELANGSKKYFIEGQKKGVEEYLILKGLEPKSPEILNHLAAGWRALGQTEEEIATLEELRELIPEDPDTLLRLGILYFEKRETVKGFKLFEAIKSIDLAKSDELMAYYR